jgi:hypothetical protein
VVSLIGWAGFQRDLVALGVNVEVLAPVMSANAHYGGTSPDWTTPTVSATVRGALFPASTRALERAGRIGRARVYELVTEPAGLSPEGRVRVAGRVFLIVDARDFVVYGHAIVEELSA